MHSHDQKALTSATRLIGAIAINGTIVAFELIFGLLAGSMALVSDAVHNIGDVGGLIVSYFAERVSRRPPDQEKTYGYHKVRFIAAFANSIVLSLAIAFVCIESFRRLFRPADVAGNEMLWIALIAFAGNTAATLMLSAISKQNFNLRTAWLHSLQDALFSLAVIIGALCIHFFGWMIIDPILSIVICAFIAREIIRIISETVSALLDSVPEGIDFEMVRQSLLKLEGVGGVSDLHIWQTREKYPMLSVHLTTEMERHDADTVVRLTQSLLRERFGIQHTTIQVLPASADRTNCTHCN